MTRPNIINRLINSQRLNKKQVQFLENSSYSVKQYVLGDNYDYQKQDFMFFLTREYPTKISDNAIHNLNSSVCIHNIYKVKSIAHKLTDEQVNKMVMGGYFEEIIERKEVNRLTEQTLYALIRYLINDFYIGSLIDVYSQVDKITRGHIKTLVRRGWSYIYNVFMNSIKDIDNVND